MIIKCNLRKTHFNQLLSYIEHQEDEGWYYGNKEQFNKRHMELKQFIKQVIENMPQDARKH